MPAMFIYAITTLATLALIYLPIRIIRSKKKTIVKALLLILLVPVLLLDIFFAYAAISSARFSLSECPQAGKTFTLDSCSVSYTEIIQNGKCKPCGGMLPCVSGFEYNKQREILQCLCNSGKTETARTFRNEYFKDQDQHPNACEEIPEKIYYL
jgi:hypothetical protein